MLYGQAVIAGGGVVMLTSSPLWPLDWREEDETEAREWMLAWNRAVESLQNM